MQVVIFINITDNLGLIFLNGIMESLMTYEQWKFYVLMKNLKGREKKHRKGIRTLLINVIKCHNKRPKMALIHSPENIEFVEIKTNDRMKDKFQGNRTKSYLS